MKPWEMTLVLQSCPIFSKLQCGRIDALAFLHPYGPMMLLIIALALLILIGLGLIGFIVVKFVLLTLLVLGGLAILLIYAGVNAALGPDMQGYAAFATLWIVTFVAFLGALISWYRKKQAAKAEKRVAVLQAMRTKHYSRPEMIKKGRLPK